MCGDKMRGELNDVISRPKIISWSNTIIYLFSGAVRTKDNAAVASGSKQTASREIHIYIY